MNDSFNCNCESTGPFHEIDCPVNVTRAFGLTTSDTTKSMSTNISNEAREAAAECAGIAYGEYLISGKDTAPLFAPVIQSLLTATTAALTARVTELEHKLKFFEGGY